MTCRSLVPIDIIMMCTNSLEVKDILMRSLYPSNLSICSLPCIDARFPNAANIAINVLVIVHVSTASGPIVRCEIDESGMSEPIRRVFDCAISTSCKACRNSMDQQDLESLPRYLSPSRPAHFGALRLFINGWVLRLLLS